MTPNVLKWIAILWLALGGVVLALAILVGPRFNLTWSEPKRTEVYLNQPFRLIDQYGQAATEKDFRGKPTAWFFGFTHCPDVCPTTLADVTQALDRLGRDADKLNVVFVTVDPERDSPKVLKEYLSSFDPRIVGLTGTREAIDTVAKNHFVHQAKVPMRDGGHMVEHTSKVLLVARDGRFVGTIDHQEPIDSQVQKLRRLVQEG